jgi:GDP-L-fucose synthase
MNHESKIFVAGGTGLVGSAILRKLVENGYKNIFASYHQRKPFLIDNVTFIQIDLLNPDSVRELFQSNNFEYVFFASARVGGIIANSTFRGQFIYENLQIQNNIIHQSYLSKVKKLLFLGSSCIYPKGCPQPMKEEFLLTDELEYTNEPYAIAKIAGIKMCESYNLQYNTNFITVMPTNLYGPNDNYHLNNSHVLPALIRKLHLASCLEAGDDRFEKIRLDFKKHPVPEISASATEQEILKYLEKNGIFASKPVKIVLWGTGNPQREFLHSNDLADACLYIMENINFSDILIKEFDIHEIKLPPVKEIRNTHINIGMSKDISIRELAFLIKEIVGFKGIIDWDSSKPDGTYQKLLDVSKLRDYGWSAKIDFKEGIKEIYREYLS